MTLFSPAYVALLLFSLTWFTFYFGWLCYCPASPVTRARIRATTIVHYVPSKHLVRSGDDVTLTAREARFFPWVLRARLFVYVGQRGRGRFLNHFGKPGPFTRVEISGADFLDRLGSGRLFYRRWDHALFIEQDYLGPATVHPDAEPRVERGRRGRDLSRPPGHSQ